VVFANETLVMLALVDAVSNIGEREAPCLADEARSPRGQRTILPVLGGQVIKSLRRKQKKWDYVVPF
jgi:hypothetical protein